MVVLLRRGPSKQGSFTPTKGPPQTKGTTSDPVSRACGLVCWTRQPFIHISNLVKDVKQLNTELPTIKTALP